MTKTNKFDTAEKIKDLRTNTLNLSQDQLAKKINVSRKTISNWENGASNPSTEILLLLALLSNVTTDYLIYDNHPLELSLNGIGDKEYNMLKELISCLETINKRKIKHEE